MHIKAVLFDLDDTLWPIMPVIRRAEDVLFAWLQTHAPAVASQFTVEGLRERRRLLLEQNPHYRLNLAKLRHAGLTEAFLAAGEDCAKIDLAMAVFSKARNEVTPFDDVIPALEKLKRRFYLGSVSNGVADLEMIGLAKYFQASIAAHSFGAAKPDAAIFHAACDALGIAPAEAVYVGDDPHLDVEGAQRAGLRAVWMNRAGLESAFKLPEHISPDATFTTMHELHQWLDAADTIGMQVGSSLE
ncbi:MAG TPA: HAD family hydrolase [Noviherbaspirillum sp.]|uniref:HAD family hydrolase n=1 Tax=Noviherbaspirillum sp. TaxID=1926288 RepID=UPI002DDD9342|nr:HAD family hydrolase [Noviherbaspirillum sp.]HEV2611086.1 HAD family hydrolase [Noviherbaspirillum sp.]